MKHLRFVQLLAVAILLGLGGWACSGGVPQPVSLHLHNESCAWCRMAISDHKLAAQLVAPNEEPKFFDEIGCLRDYLAAQTTLPKGALAYVTDHRTEQWIRADRAAYTKAMGLATPMGSHLIAHENITSWREDPNAPGSLSITGADVFGPNGPPNGEGPSK